MTDGRRPDEHEVDSAVEGKSSLRSRAHARYLQGTGGLIRKAE